MSCFLGAFFSLFETEGFSLFFFFHAFSLRSIPFLLYFAPISFSFFFLVSPPLFFSPYSPFRRLLLLFFDLLFAHVILLFLEWLHISFMLCPFLFLEWLHFSFMLLICIHWSLHIPFFIFFLCAYLLVLFLSCIFSFFFIFFFLKNSCL